ncbi:hypothetical protein QBC43DRAFT_337644 [Cladorrhinum sp. PSN259]|nr:hypothetical protein QBC43DRAFT_337644 [Cladorrhinum sp. PSN259]
MANSTNAGMELEFDAEDFLPLSGTDSEYFIISPKRRGATSLGVLPTSSSGLVLVSPRADVLLAITIGPAARVFRVETAVLAKFTKWWPAQVKIPNMTIYSLELGVAAHFDPVCSPFLLLDALAILLKCMHSPKEEGRSGMAPQHIFALSLVAREILGLESVFIEWFKSCMGVFMTDMHRDDQAVRVPGVVWEQALVTCHRFGWVEIWTGIASRLAVYSHFDFSGGFPEKLGLPNGQVVKGEAVGTVLESRMQLVKLFLSWANKSLRGWIKRLEIHPSCSSQACTNNRLGALRAFAKVSALLSHPTQTAEVWNKSIFEIIAGLQIITGDHKILPKPLFWAEKIRKRFAGTCTECPEKAPTSYLFPLEDVLTDLTWSLNNALFEYSRYPFPTDTNMLNGKWKIKSTAGSTTSQELEIE